MDKGIVHMLDAKAVSGTFATAMVAASPTWMDTASTVVTLVVTLVVGGLTAWYTWERAIKLKREREDEDK